MKLFSLVRAGLLAALPFLFTTLQTATIGACGAVAFHTPCIESLAAGHGLNANALSTLLFLYEAIARFVPTSNNYSLFALAGRLLDQLQTNRAKSDPDSKLVLQHTAHNGLKVYGLA